MNGDVRSVKVYCSRSFFFFYLLMFQMERFHYITSDAAPRKTRTFKVFEIKVIEFITFHINPKLRNVPEFPCLYPWF